MIQKTKSLIHANNEIIITTLLNTYVNIVFKRFSPNDYKIYNTYEGQLNKKTIFSESISNIYICVFCLRMIT